MTRVRDDEFPLLKPMGLQACPIRGDGNCLFNALSDQIYGNQARHAEIRMGVIRYMRENPEKFKPFLTVGGGQRRNPKRKNAGAFSSRFAFTVATEEETNAAYEAHLTQMAQGGTWGDNIEIIAFSYAYNTDVKIYKASHAYYVRVSAENNVRPVAHIAYHTWEHYSSIRNINGPMTGLPQVQVIELSEEYTIPRAAASTNQGVDPWKIKAVTGFLPHLIDQAAIIKALEESRGNINSAVGRLLDAEYSSSQPSTPFGLSSAGSSSVERDSDSDDDEIYRPSKRQNRSMKTTMAVRMESEELSKEVGRGPDSSSVELSTGSHDQDIRGSGKRGNHPMKTARVSRKEEYKQRIDVLNGSHSVELTTSDSESESENLRQSYNVSTKSATARVESDEDDEFTLPLQSHNVKVKPTIRKAKKADDENLSAPSDGEADDEYPPDGEYDADSDFIPNIGNPSVLSSTPSHSQRKMILQVKRMQRMQRQARKEGKRNKASGRLIESTIKNLNRKRISSPIGGVVGMKILFI